MNIVMAVNMGGDDFIANPFDLEELPRIFERGFTGYNGRLDKKSTGIGLYLCRQITDKLSHTLRVESKVGKGTRVIPGFVQDAM